MAKKPESENPALDAIEDIVADSIVEADTLAGDVRDCLLEIIKHRPKPWGQMTEAEQNDTARTIEYASRDLVTKVVEAIAAKQAENTPIRAILESYTEKDGIKAALKIKTIGEDDAAVAVVSLHKARGKVVMITLASAQDYMGERGEFEADPDQAGLEFEAGSDVIDGEPFDAGDEELEGN